MAGFTKLCSCITSSSIWNEDDKTRIVWITMLAMCEPSGLVPASVGGLAHVARVTREDCETALKILESPDTDSRSPEHEGRRIKRVDGGFLLLNYGKYREARSDDERRAYMREYMKGYRKTGVNKRKQTLDEVSQGKPQLAKEEGEAEAEEEEKERATPAVIDSQLQSAAPSLPDFLAEVRKHSLDVTEAFVANKYHGKMENGFGKNWRAFAARVSVWWREQFHTDAEAKKAKEPPKPRKTLEEIELEKLGLK